MFARLLVSILLCLLGYTLSSYGKQESTTQATEKGTVEDTALERMSQETFTRLRGMFENPILDKDFKTLKQVTSSTVYLDFLKQAYPRETPFETLGEFLKDTPLRVERYRRFLKAYFTNLTDTDFRSIHLWTLTYRRTDMIMLSDKTKDKNPMQKAFTERVFITGREPIRTWWRSRISGKTEEKKMAFLISLGEFAKDTQIEDVAWIQTHFETHGRENALLWLSLRKPLLTFEILTNFRSPAQFLTWVEEIQKTAETEHP